ncbi:MAG: hypothetical protein IPJ07_24595 [Acidobacteria bacterium]|nr:hypothetical protein [Acidobacteriota bacterium]
MDFVEIKVFFIAKNAKRVQGVIHNLLLKTGWNRQVRPNPGYQSLAFLAMKIPLFPRNPAGWVRTFRYEVPSAGAEQLLIVLF